MVPARPRPIVSGCNASAGGFDGAAPAADAAARPPRVRNKGWIAFSALTGQGDWDPVRDAADG